MSNDPYSHGASGGAGHRPMHSSSGTPSSDQTIRVKEVVQAVCKVFGDRIRERVDREFDAANQTDMAPFLEKFYQLHESEVKKQTEQLLSGYQQILNDTNSSLFRAAQSLEKDLKDVGRDVKGSFKMGLLREVIGVIDKIATGVLDTPESISETLVEMLQLNGLVKVPVEPGDAFDPEKHNVISTEPTVDPTKDRTVCRVRGTCWRYPDSQRPCIVSKVVLWKSKSREESTGKGNAPEQASQTEQASTPELGGEPEQGGPHRSDHPSTTENREP